MKVVAVKVDGLSIFNTFSSFDMLSTFISPSTIAGALLAAGFFTETIDDVKDNLVAATWGLGEDTKIIREKRAIKGFTGKGTSNAVFGNALRYYNLYLLFAFRNYNERIERAIYSIPGIGNNDSWVQVKQIFEPDDSIYPVVPFQYLNPSALPHTQVAALKEDVHIVANTILKNPKASFRTYAIPLRTEKITYDAVIYSRTTEPWERVYKFDAPLPVDWSNVNIKEVK